MFGLRLVLNLGLVTW